MLLLLSTLLWANPEDESESSNEMPSEPNIPNNTEENSREEPDVVEPTEEQKSVEPTLKSEEAPSLVSQKQFHDTQILNELILLLSEETPIEDRLSLLEKIHKEPNVLPALKTLSLYGPIEIRQKSLVVLKEHPNEKVTYEITEQILRTSENNELILNTYGLLNDLKTEAAATVLKKQAENTDASAEKRKQARIFLEQHYPNFLSKNPLKVLVADPLARGIFSTGSAILGGNLFSTLGQLSQGEDGSAVGGFTGTLSGAVGGFLYSQDKSFSYGSALYFIHANSWGSFMGSQLSEQMNLDYNMSSIMQSLGSLGGAAYGIHTLETDRSVRDIVEHNIIMGQSIFLATSLWGVSGNEDSNMDGLLLGSFAGLALGEFIAPEWEPDVGTALLASLYSGESAFLGLSLNDAGIGNDWLTPCMVSAAIIAAEVQDHIQNPGTETLATSIYGAYTGHIFGSGIGNLQGSSSTLPIAIGGMGGMIAGGYISNNSPYLDSSYLLGSSILVAANTFGIYGLVDATQGSTQMTDGIRDVSTGLGNIGMLYAQDVFNLTGEKTLFLTSSSLWGSYFAVTSTTIIGAEPSEIGTITLLLSSFDIGLGAGAYLLNRPGFDIQNTINPQLFGIIGGSLGAFGAYLVNDSPRSLAVGSLLGVGIGGYLGTKYSIELPEMNFFDKIFLSAAPQISPDGDIGIQAHIGGIIGN